MRKMWPLWPRKMLPNRLLPRLLGDIRKSVPQLTEGTGVYCYRAENARYGLADTIGALREISGILDSRYP